MDNDSTGRSPFRTLGLCMTLAVIGVALNACAQHPAGAQSMQPEDLMQGQPPTQSDIEAEQDKAAASADTAARAAQANAAPSTGGEDGDPDLPAGPALTPDEISNGIVKLAASLQHPDDTDPAKVSHVLGIKLSADAEGRRTGTKGELGTGTYEVAVWKPSSEQVGQLIELRFEPRERSGCPMGYEDLKTRLAATGYVAKPAPRYVKPRVYFEKKQGSLTSYVTIDTDHHDEPACAWVVSLQLERNDG